MSELNIPETWALGEVKLLPLLPWGQVATPKDCPTAECLVEMEDIEKDSGRINFEREVPTKISTKNVFHQGDILYGKLRPYLNKCGVAEKHGICSSEIFVIGPSLFNSDFLAFFFRSTYFLNYSNSKTHGARMPRLSSVVFQEAELPIPPRKEQERIVQKIESCFSKIEETEHNLNKVEILLEKYRESLLAKAFRGELIPQNPDDDPASVLLAKIREERAQNQKGKKKEQEFSPISDDEKPFDIPQGWEAIKLGEVAAFIDYRGKTPKKIDSGIKLITAKNVRMGYIKNDPEEFISEKDYVGWMTRGFPGTNDLLITTEAPMGNVAITPVGFKFALAQRIINLKINENVNANFLMYLIMFKDFQRHLDKLGTGATVKGIKASVLKNIYIYFPSMKTQLRIVDSLDKSFALIEVIRRNVVKNKTHLNQFKEALLIKAFEGRLVEQIESEGTGHELLQKILKQKEQEISVKESTKKKVVKKVSKKETTKK